VSNDSEMPEPLKALRIWLVSHGFTLAEEHRSDSFGDRFEMWVHDRCRVRIVRDKAEWALEISGDGISGWFDPDTWKACLDGDEPPQNPRALIAQTAFLESSLSQIETALMSPETLQQCLRRRNLSRLGFPTDPHS
jgi:hypothetical protein